jgi:hypothetical protein
MRPSEQVCVVLRIDCGGYKKVSGNDAQSIIF